jgi:hypothetical protein
MPCVHQKDALGGDRFRSMRWQFYFSHSLPQFVSAARNLITCQQSVNMFAKKISTRFTSERYARRREQHRMHSHTHPRFARCIVKASSGAACMHDACFDDAIVARSRMQECDREQREGRRKKNSSTRVRMTLLRVAQAKMRGLATS